MDQDPCHCVFCPRGHNADPDPESYHVPWVPSHTTRWSPDAAGAPAAGLHIRSLPAGSFADTLHYAAILHLQLQQWELISQLQEEEEVTRNLTKTDFFFLILECDFWICNLYLSERLHDLKELYAIFS